MIEKDNEFTLGYIELTDHDGHTILKHINSIGDIFTDADGSTAIASTQSENIVSVQESLQEVLDKIDARIEATKVFKRNIIEERAKQQMEDIAALTAEAQKCQSDS